MIYRIRVPESQDLCRLHLGGEDRFEVAVVRPEEPLYEFVKGEQQELPHRMWNQLSRKHRHK